MIKCQCRMILDGQFPPLAQTDRFQRPNKNNFFFPPPPCRFIGTWCCRDLRRLIEYESRFPRSTSRPAAPFSSSLYNEISRESRKPFLSFLLLTWWITFSKGEKRDLCGFVDVFFFVFFILLLSPLSWGGCSYSPVTSSAPSSSWVAARSHLIDWMLRVLMEVCPGPTKRKNMVRASEFAMPSLSGRRLRHWRILFWASADGNKHTERCDGRLYI